MRSKKALANISVSILLHFVAIGAGLIVPRLIISTFGSSVNGLISSINHFLGYIVLLEAGVGGVVRAALYKPLAKKDKKSISRILKATERFFRIVAYVFIGYLIIIALVFPYLVSDIFSSVFVFTLVLIMGISSLVQYYFGITYMILLNADQKKYISSFLRIITLIINSALIIILVKLGASIHIIKLASAVTFVIRPFLINIYVKRRYNIIKDCLPDNDAIKQRWDGLGHHLAYLLHNNTDVTLITLFANMKEVSVYAVHFLVINSIKKLTVTFSSSIEAAFGNMIAREEQEALSRNFRVYEFISFTITTILFTSTALLISPFISIYTSGVTDVSYHRPLFAYLLIAAEAVYCIRIPYNAVVLAAGHYRETRNGAFLEAFINIGLSIVLINIWGLVGVAIGTLSAMLFRTIQYAAYLSRNILKRSVLVFIKKAVIYLTAVLVIILIVRQLPLVSIDSYSEWILQAVKVTVISSSVTLLIGIIFYFNDLKNLFTILKRVIKKRE